MKTTRRFKHGDPIPLDCRYLATFKEQILVGMNCERQLVPTLINGFPANEYRDVTEPVYEEQTFHYYEQDIK